MHRDSYWIDSLATHISACVRCIGICGHLIPPSCTHHYSKKQSMQAFSSSGIIQRQRPIWAFTITFTDGTALLLVSSLRYKTFKFWISWHCMPIQLYLCIFFRNLGCGMDAAGLSRRRTRAPRHTYRLYKPDGLPCVPRRCARHN